MYAVALAFAVALAGWAVWQLAHGEARAHAVFETPATLTATINLLLLPGLVWFSWGRRNALFAAALILLVAGLAAAQSRGGWLAFAAGLAFAVVLSRRANLSMNARASIPAIGIVVAGFALAKLASPAVHWLAQSFESAPEFSMLSAEAASSSAARLDLYRVAIEAASGASPLWGSGYLSFYYHLEAVRTDVLGYRDSVTYFVHNDYLQILLELGVPGLLGLLALILLPLGLAWRAAARPAMEMRSRLVLVAAAAALAATATHALVDYPFYIPVCLVLFGGAAGVIDSILFPPSASSKNLAVVPPSSVWRRIASGAAVALGLWALLVPALAENAARYAQHQWRAANAEATAYWFEAARRIAPRDWRYHWYAGQFWFALAAGNSNRGAASLADAAFAAGDAANPHEVRNLVGRISTHRRLRPLLASPAEAKTLHEWSDRALALAPRDRAVLAERAALARQLGPNLSGSGK